MSSIILQTKLIIPLAHPNLVPRTRLSEQIEAGVVAGHKLTLVAAPAGFGKSTAASAWVHQCGRQVAWLSLDEGDNETTIFWTYVIAAIRAVRPDFAEDAFTALTASPPAPVNTILPALLNALAGLRQPLTLVLDDYHVIENPEIYDSFAFLLEHQPRQFHVVIATRADPPLPLARLRARRSLTELRAADLRFTYEEAQSLLNGIMELGLTAEDVQLLEARTEGWGVGLLLAAQSMQGRSDKREFIAAFSGSQHYILEYLVEEVLKRQSDAARSFLLQTSILDRLSGSLCNAVTGGSGSGEMLARLSKQNLFVIPLDQDHTWYRYHHLFAELLVNFLQKEFARPDVLELHRRASGWHAAAGDVDRAVKYALSGEDFERAADLIEQIVDRVIARGQVKTLLQWIGAFPEAVIQSRPRLLVHQGWIVFLSGKVNAASAILQEAKQALTAIPAGPERDLLRGRLAAMLATITALTRDLPGAIAEAQEALAYLPAAEFISRARALRALGVCYLFQGELGQALESLEQARLLALEGQNRFLASEILSQTATVRKQQGKLSLASETYRQILALYQSPEQAPPACLGYVGLAEIALERNDLLDAQAYLDMGIELGWKGNIGYALQPAYLIGGMLGYALGDEQAARETIKEGEGLSRLGGGSLESILGLAWFQTRLHLQLGDLDKARAWATGAILPPGWSLEAMPPVLDELHQSLLARVYLKSGEYEKVLDVHARVCAQAETGGRQARVIELSLFKAVALQALGQPEAALESLEKCLALAEPGGYVRLFLETGEAVIELLREARAQGICPKYAAALLAAFQGEQAEAAPDRVASLSGGELIEPLTRRELEVLEWIYLGFTNQEIADQMVVSVNTVKKHTSNIYGKLGVRNRAQAVLCALELGLVQGD